METLDIKIRESVIHILDSYLPVPVLSDSVLDHGSDINDFLRSHINKILAGDDAKDCVFQKDQSDVYAILEQMHPDAFIEVSKELAIRLFEIMNANPEIPPADLMVVLFEVEGEKGLALLKMNYKTSYTHTTLQSETGNNNDIIIQKAILPSENQKLSEAVVINLEDYNMKLIEKKYEVNGEKMNYFSSLYLNCTTELSPKAKINVVAKAAQDVYNKFYENSFDKQMEAKSIINRQLEEEGGLEISTISEEIFKEQAELKEEFQEKIEKYNINDVKVVPKNEQTAKKYAKQHITTDTGIEIKIPMEQYNKTNSVEFITNEDGSISVLIKNIGKITSK